MREDNGCFLVGGEVLREVNVQAVIGSERLNGQVMEKCCHGRWRMTYGLSGEMGSQEFSGAGM